jgi:adenylate cyclase
MCTLDEHPIVGERQPVMVASTPGGRAPILDAGYEIRFEPAGRRVRVEFNGVPVAESSRAVVLHETRARPTIYIPPEDVRMDYFEQTPLRTYCPFKGNASHWALRVGGSVAENAAWSYDEPYPDAQPIRGYVSFYQNEIATHYEGGDEVAFEVVEGGAAHANPIAGWLINDAWKAGSTEQLMEQFCRFLRDAGYPLARSTLIIPTLHPQVFASVLAWRDDAPRVRVVFEPHDILRQPRFADSPFAPILGGAGGVRRYLADPQVKLDFPVVRDLHREGATDYVAMPFRFSDGQINVVSMTSFAKEGFTTAHLGSIHEVLPALGRMFEVHAQRRISVGLLDTYLGHDTGRRVLEGQIRHGDGQIIHAVIWYCDLRDSTQLAESMETADYQLFLNRFFAATAGPIIDSGGEVLSYIGDGVFAIFPIADDRRAPDIGLSASEACSKAIRAARVATGRIASANAANPDLPVMRFGIGLHIGDVTYGNIGIPERMQFTVIGPAANVASRIEDMTKALGEPILVSAEFAEQYSGRLVSRGFHALKGVKGARELLVPV